MTRRSGRESLDSAQSVAFEIAPVGKPEIAGKTNGPYPKPVTATTERAISTAKWSVG
jgi:hypothetical protein